MHSKIDDTRCSLDAERNQPHQWQCKGKLITHSVYTGTRDKAKTGNRIKHCDNDSSSLKCCSYVYLTLKNESHTKTATPIKQPLSKSRKTSPTLHDVLQIPRESTLHFPSKAAKRQTSNAVAWNHCKIQGIDDHLKPDVTPSPYSPGIAPCYSVH